MAVAFCYRRWWRTYVTRLFSPGEHVAEIHIVPFDMAFNCLFRFALLLGYMNMTVFVNLLILILLSR